VENKDFGIVGGAFIEDARRPSYRARLPLA
jgi:hypothetical protein